MAAALIVHRLARRLPLFPIAAVFVCLCEGWALGTGHTKYAALPVAAVAGAYALQRPIFLLVAPLAYISIAAPAYVKVAHLGAGEAILCLGVGVVVIRGEFEVERTGIWLAILVALCLNGIFVGEGHGLTFHDGFIAFRGTLGFLAYWVALALFRANRARTLTMLGWVAAAVAVLTIAQELLPHHKLYLGQGISQTVRNQDGFLRVRLPGDLIYVGAFFSLAYLLWGPAERRRTAFAATGMFGAAILISLNRNWILGLAIGGIVTWVLGRPDARSTFRMFLLAVVAAVVLAAAGGTAVGSRILSLGNTSGLEQSTLADRHYEDFFAKRTLHKHPLVGVGWAPYGASVNDSEGVPHVRDFIHNQYLSVWLRAGIVGLFALLAVMLRSFTGALGSFRRDDDWVAAGAAAAIVGIAASSIVGIYVMQEASAMTLAILFALCTVLRTRDEAD